MTAAELASFRALLQAQSAPPARPDRGLFARMRARLTVVEGGAPAAAVPRREPATWLELVAPCAAEGPVANPPPSSPPTFGRRDGGAPLRPDIPQTPPTAVAEATAEPVRLRALDSEAEGPTTPDAFDDDVRRQPLPTPGSASGSTPCPAPGNIAGWSRTRPTSARRRLLGRLEAVLLAERQGLDMRREAEASPR